MKHLDRVSAFNDYLDTQYGKVPSDVSVSARYVVSNMEVAERAAQALFGEKVTPELVIMIYDRIMGAIPKITADLLPHTQMHTD